jgi:hypothetical protein
MQGIILALNGDIWAVDQGKSQVIHLPGGDPTLVEFFCQNEKKDPLNNPCGGAVRPMRISLRLPITAHVRLHRSDATRGEQRHG